MSVTGNYTGFAVAVVGTNGTGKTFYMDKMIQGYERPVLALIGVWPKERGLGEG